LESFIHQGALCVKAGISKKPPLPLTERKGQ
jgi:hypothetical protein